jgi:hypothetical protein
LCKEIRQKLPGVEGGGNDADERPFHEINGFETGWTTRSIWGVDSDAQWFMTGRIRIEIARKRKKRTRTTAIHLGWQGKMGNPCDGGAHPTRKARRIIPRKKSM